MLKMKEKRNCKMEVHLASEHKESLYSSWQHPEIITLFIIRCCGHIGFYSNPMQTEPQS